MGVPCPNCQAPLNPKGLKPGSYKPKCPKCGVVFLLNVPDDPTDTIMARKLPVATAATIAQPNAVADPNSTGNFTEAMDPNATGMSDSPGSDDPYATGNFTEPAAYQSDSSKSSDPFATGNFTEADTSDNDDPESTGAFQQRQANEDANRTAMHSGDDDDAPPQRPAANKSATKKKKPDADGGDDIPEKLGGYEVIKVLGKGGMGAVLLGRQVSLDRKVALKIMHKRLARDPGFVARFTREAYAAAQLVHHNVIQIYDIGEESGTHFFSMEFVPGQSLMELVKSEGKLDIEVAVGYILQAARGLRYGHAQGMVHRDIKPDNLMLNTEGIVKVADLGLVKLPNSEIKTPLSDHRTDEPSEEAPALDDDADADTQQLTRAGTVMGTPAYMPPEQARDSASVDQRADIYSLGCTLYVLVTGKPPYSGKTALEVISKHQTEPLVPPETIVKRVPKALSGILQKMLAKKPEHRFQNMDEVITALETFLGLNRTGPFTPKEEHAVALEKSVASFTSASKSNLKKLASLGFFAVGILAMIILGVTGRVSWAGGVLGLLVMTPVAYFVISGVMGKSFLFAKVREWFFGSRLTDWLTWAGGVILFILTLYIFNFLWAWLGFGVLAVALAFALWSLTDRAEQSAQSEPLDDARIVFKAMRLQGLDEEALRQFVCKYAGKNWESYYEVHFGYEAKLGARAYRKGAITEAAPTYAAWREPAIAWIENRIRARQEAKERKLLEQVEVKALEAKGVSATDAQAQAEELADAMVGQANQAKEAKKEGKKVDLRAMVQAAKAAKRPREGYNIAGIKRQPRGLAQRLNDLLGRRFRFLAGAAVFAIGLLWLNGNKDILQQLLRGVEATASNLSADALNDSSKQAVQTAETISNSQSRMRPLSFLPAGLCHFGLPLGGFMLMISGLFYYGWKPSLVALPGCAIAVLGPALGIPDVGVPAWVISTLVGGVLMLVVARFLRS